MEKTRNSKLTVLFCTAAGESYGFGHLKRCFSLIDEAGSDFDCYIHIRRGNPDAVLQRQDFSKKYRFVSSIDDAGEVDLIVSDMRETRRREMLRLVQRAPVISIDDMAASRELSHLLVYSLPTEEKVVGNLNGYQYIVLDSRIRNITPLPFSQKKGVLVSFGGSDPYDITGAIVPVLNSVGIAPKIIRGPLFSHHTHELEGEVIENPDDIYDLINSARVLITSFGITMYEAFFFGTPVILFGHSAYHYRLARRVSGMNLGYRGSLPEELLKQRLLSFLKDEGRLKESAEKNRALVDGEGAKRIVSLFNKMKHALRRDCFFGHKRHRVLKRSDEYTLFQCTKCKDLFLQEIKSLPSIYNDEKYFLSEYKRQYGCTYIEDRENIEQLGNRRIQIIERIAKGRGKILDVGCALGFFLHLSAIRGWETRGIEVSHFASQWGRRELTVDITEGSFLDMDFPPEFFDVVTFFFVVEHFKAVERVFEKAQRILKPHGIIAIALPNRSGITFRLNRTKYIQDHPRDHYFDTNPRNLTRLLKKYGFKRKRIYITGVHPERFFKAVGCNVRWKFLERVYCVGARIFRLGDTFEYYGIKI